MWPARAGAFSVIIGRHYSPFDVRSLPFSYILNHGSESAVIPAMNLFTTGLVRVENRTGRDAVHVARVLANSLAA